MFTFPREGVLICTPPRILDRTRILMCRFSLSSLNSMIGCFTTRISVFRFFTLLLLAFIAFSATSAQTSDDELDPIKLFELGQDAHARGELERAVELYSEAIALRPEFAEAEYQRGVALVSLERLLDAEKSLRRAAEIRSDWALPLALLGDVMVRQRRFADAELPLTSALKLEPANYVALVALAYSRLHSKSTRDQLVQLLSQLRAATSQKDALAGIWLTRGSIERALGDYAAALKSYDRCLVIEPRNILASIERAEVLAITGDIEGAVQGAEAARCIAPASVYVSTSLARLYLQAGNCEQATHTLDDLDAITKHPTETVSLRNAIALECASGEQELNALEAALLKEPRNPEILARLCVLNRVDDPPRALDYCRRALEIQPGNVDYGSSYAAALVQARRFADAVVVLRQVVAVAPGKFVARANLALALYELGRFQEALVQYNWIIETKPETTAAYFFVAIIHDKLGEYQHALDAYQIFLARADPQQFKLEIDKVNLRLPPLRNQIKRGQGVKRKP